MGCLLCNIQKQFKTYRCDKRDPCHLKIVPKSKYHYTGVEIKLHTFLTSAEYGGEWSASRSGRFTHGETLLCNRQRPVRPHLRSEFEDKGKYLCYYCRESNPVFQPEVSPQFIVTFLRVLVLAHNISKFQS
jgi:hypothetical protein